VARTLSKLVAEGKLAPPRRTIRFVWPPEIEGTMALLAGKPDLAGRIRAAIHLDMVGGGPETKAVFMESKATRAPRQEQPRADPQWRAYALPNRARNELRLRVGQLLLALVLGEILVRPAALLQFARRQN
jgi:hypothetical protein